jgi:hypothetical protein
VIDDERHLHRMARERVGVAEIAVLERAPHEIRQFAEHAVDVAKIGCAAVVARAADHVEQRLLARLQQHVAAAPRAFERDQLNTSPKMIWSRTMHGVSHSIAIPGNRPSRRASVISAMPRTSAFG